MCDFAVSRSTWFKVTPSPQTSPSFVPRFSIGLPGTSTASVGTTFRVSGLNGGNNIAKQYHISLYCCRGGIGTAYACTAHHACTEQYELGTP